MVSTDPHPPPFPGTITLFPRFLVNFLKRRQCSLARRSGLKKLFTLLIPKSQTHSTMGVGDKSIRRDRPGARSCSVYFDIDSWATPVPGGEKVGLEVWWGRQMCGQQSG